MQRLTVPAVCDIYAFVTRDWMGSYSLCGADAVFVFFLSFGMHYQEGVMWKVDGDLALYVRSTYWRCRRRCRCRRPLFFAIITIAVNVIIEIFGIIRWHYLPHPELPHHA